MLDKFISPLIAKQFPSFYQEQGPNFIAFVKAYYEWMEQTGNFIGPIGGARSIPDYLDIDSTSEQFIKYFKNTYIKSIPENIALDKALLTKHILDLYRSKGSKRAYELLFRLLFNEDIELVLPSDYIFKPSDNLWFVPQYIEMTDNIFLSNIIGKNIKTISGSSSAIVDNVIQKNINGKIINIVFLSSIKGAFSVGERILFNDMPEITISNAPLITGSLTAVAIEDGGYGFDIGDTLDIIGAGKEAKARVVSVRDENGKVSFQLIDGGSGFTLNSIVSVYTTLNILINNISGSFNINDTVTDTTTSATGTVSFANSSFLEIINFSSSLSFVINDTISNGAGSTATITSVFGGTGSGAKFSIGSLSNKESTVINADYFYPRYIALSGGSIDETNSAKLEPSGFIVNFSTTSNLFFGTVNSSANVVMLEGNYTSGKVNVGETLSNSVLGISNLYVYKSDGAQIWVTGPDSNLTNVNLISGTTLLSSSTSSTFNLIAASPKQTINGSGTVVSQTTTSITLSSVTGEFVSNNKLTMLSGANTANITSMARLSNWSMGHNTGLDNLDTVISTALLFSVTETGTIASFSNTSPGINYSTKPYVTIVEPSIYQLNIDDGRGGIKGFDASVKTSVSNQKGIVQAVKIIDTGFGYNPDETVTLKNANNATVVSGATIIKSHGFSSGKWRNNKSFISDLMKIEDSYYYQNHSYEIAAKRMLSTYENLVKTLIHPSGIALFGKYQLRDYQIITSSGFKEMTITQTSPNPSYVSWLNNSFLPVTWQNNSLENVTWSFSL
jgi:hypothetical protein